MKYIICTLALLMALPLVARAQELQWRGLDQTDDRGARACMVKDRAWKNGSVDLLLPLKELALLRPSFTFGESPEPAPDCPGPLPSQGQA